MAKTTSLFIVLSIFSIGNVLSSSSPPTGCKQLVIAKYGFFNTPSWRMDNPSLQHVTYQKNAHGITHFEMNISLKSQDVITIALAHHGDMFDHNPEDFFFIKTRPSKLVLTKRRDIINTIYAEHLTSWNYFTEFYIKIADDRLEFGERGHSPLFSYKDAGLRSMQYFAIGGGNTDNYKPSQIYFDCP